MKQLYGKGFFKAIIDVYLCLIFDVYLLKFYFKIQEMEQRLEQIKEMEEILNRTNDLVEKIDKMLQEWAENLLEFKKLMAYYGSEQWFDDHDAYRNGEIPKGFPCGVLGEDLAYDTFGAHRDLALRMIKLGVSALED